jgi:hypothetical protein
MMNNIAVGWRLSAVRTSEYIELTKPKSTTETFKTKNEADRRGALLKAIGHVVSVTPIY